MTIRPLLRIVSLLAAVVLSAIQASAYSTDYYASQSLLASGTWVRVTIDRSGIYQLSYEQLRAAGFADPERVTVWGYAGTALTANTFDDDLPDDLVPAASMHTADGRLLFYGQGTWHARPDLQNRVSVNRNLYDTVASYFITDGLTQPAPETIALGDATAAPINWHTCIDLEERELGNPGKGGAAFHSKPLAPGESESYTLRVRDFDLESGQRGFFFMEYAALSSVRTTFTATWPNNVSCQQIYMGSAVAPSKANRLYTTGYGTHQFVKDSRNQLVDTELHYTFTHPATSQASYAAVDRVYLHYPRTSRLRRFGQLEMHFTTAQPGQSFTVADATADTRVWDVTDPVRVRPYATAYDEASATVRATFDSTYTLKSPGCVVTFDPAAQFPQAEIAGYVPNQNIHGSATPQMVIITTEALEPLARQLAEAHRLYQGMDVAVYTQQQVYNEFSSGTRAAMAYRRMAKMFYDRDPQTFRHLLLYGASSWDNRGVTMNLSNLLISYESELDRWANDKGTNFAADSYFGMLADSYDPTLIHAAKLKINVGRIPARDKTKAAQYNAKALAWLATPPSPFVMANAVMISDDGNRMAHINQSEAAIAEVTGTHDYITCTRGHNLLYPWQGSSAVQLRSVITDALTRGVGYFTYSGHANEIAFGAEDLWSTNAAEAADYAVPPIAMLATCDAYAFDRLDNGIGETMLFKPRGGMIAVIGACRSVYLEYNQNFNLPFASHFAHATGDMTIGDVFRLAYNDSKTGTNDDSAMANSLCFNLAGDPALPLYAPSLRAVIDTVDGVAIDSSTPAGSVGVPTLRPVTVTGHIATDNGVATDFDGEVELVLYEAPRTVMTVTKDGSHDADEQPITLDETILTRVTASVANGRFTARLFSPDARSTDGPSRLCAYAIEQAAPARRAAGLTKAVTVTNSEADFKPQSNAPAILAMYIDSPAFVAGAVTGTSVMVLAEIDTSIAGIDLSEGHVGSGVKLSLDNSRTLQRVSAYITTDPATGRAMLAYPVTELAEGAHRITLTVINNAGEAAIASVHFVVKRRAGAAMLSVSETPARDVATLMLAESSAPAIATRLLVRDASGRTVVSERDCTFPYSWDLCDMDGEDVPDGRYEAFVVVETAAGDASSEAIEVIVLR